MLSALHAIVAYVVRRTWLVASVTVLVCASYAASAVAALSNPDGEPTGRAAAAPGPAKAPAAPARTKLDGDQLVQRNMFCSSCAPAVAGASSPTYQGHPAVLIATSIGRESRATVRVVPTEVQGSWGLGEVIPGVGRVDRIEHTTIEVIDEGGHSKLLTLLTQAADPGPGAATPGGGSAAPPGPFAGRVTKLDDTTYEVERSLVRELVMGGAKPGAGRAMPVMDDKGAIKGVRLLGIGSQSVGHALGLRSSDVISMVDGAPLGHVQQMLDLFAKLDQVSSVELAGSRGAKPLKLTLKLR